MMSLTRRRFITALTGASVGQLLASTIAFADAGDKGFYYGAHAPRDLVALIKRSLERDQNGNAQIDPHNCSTQGGCATPRHYLEAFRLIPELQGRVKMETFADLLGFLEQLKVMDPPVGGAYEVASLRPNGRGGHQVIMDGVKHRVFEPGEKAWVYEYEMTHKEKAYTIQVAVITSKCANPIYRKIATELTVTGRKCGESYTITANAWSLASFPEVLKAKAEALIAAANARDAVNGKSLTAYQGDAISRTLGKPMREGVKKQAPIQADIKIRYVSVNSATGEASVDKEGRVLGRDVGTLKMVNGAGTFTFPDDPRNHIVEVVWPDVFLSPTMSAGARILRLFPNEWGDFCGVHMHGIVP